MIDKYFCEFDHVLVYIPFHKKLFMQLDFQIWF